MEQDRREKGPVRRFISRIDVFGGRIAILSSLAGSNKDHTTYQPSTERPDTKPTPGSEEMKKSGVEAMQEMVAKNPPELILYETQEVEKTDKSPDEIPMDDYYALNFQEDLVKGLQQFGFPTDQVGRMTRRAAAREKTEQGLQQTYD